jgi:hypothetical protein
MNVSQLLETVDESGHLRLDYHRQGENGVMALW